MEGKLIAEQALKEHEHLNAEIKVLKIRLSVKCDDSVSDWFAHCVDHFRHFHTQLRKHMEFEEADGFMDPVSDQRPTLSPQVEVLRHEHRQLISECVKIEHFLITCKSPTSTDVSSARNQIDQLLERLHHHEMEENKLVLEAFTRDIGVGD